MRRASSARTPGACAFTAKAALRSPSAWSTAVYAPALTTSRGARSRTTRAIREASERSSAARSQATTLPCAASAAASSRPSWPFAPVTRMVGWMLERRPGMSQARGSGVDVGLRERLAGGVLGRERRRIPCRPFDAKRRIVPQQRALVLRVPVVGGLVEEFGDLRDDDEPVRETRRDVEHPVIARRQLDRDVPAEGRRRASQVDGHVEHPALDHANELSLRMLDLVMHAAQHAAARSRVVVLHEIDVEPGS